MKYKPKNTPTPQMINYMLSVLLKPIFPWKYFGKEARARKIYAQEISDAYKTEFEYGRKLLNFCKDLQKLNEEHSEDLNNLKIKINELVTCALTEDYEIEGTLH